MKRSYITMLALAAVLSSCKDNEVFEQEMYKNEVALISSSYYNTFQEIVPLTGEEVTGYIAASAGGTYAPTEDMVIHLEEDDEQLDVYNRSLFDADERLYAKLLPKDRYVIEDYRIVVKAGQRTGRTMVKLNPEGLSPDSTYFIELKARDMSGVEINSKKNSILYQVLIKNDYASQADNTFYAMTGLVDERITAGNKKLFPLSRNSVKMVAGTESFESDADHINKTSIILEVGADNKVTIKPYKDIVVRQIDGNDRYPNVFRVEESFGRKFNVFSISYEYVINGSTHTMQEELRIQVNK
ncbi:BT_3044 domain-containing protein [Desertivirga xinjiangensis]|uniref:BT_3044 domain-containing protein n=1 Tax=Desertivirga xinjiangensis TaxID=539206 RepID=UPI0021093BE1|nr:DUF4361 domain-containing protein [Pedobacter xinjiangensis]